MKARDNPFAPSRLEKVLAFDPLLIGTTWEALETRWRELGHRAAVTGHHGSGKSALLAAWSLRLASRGEEVAALFYNKEHDRISPFDRHLLADCEGKQVLIDGEIHLPWRERALLRKLLAPAAGVLVTRHRSGSWRELVRLQSSPRLAAALLERVLPECRPLGLADLSRNLRRHRGNLRELWLSFYDDLARQNGHIGNI